MKISHDEVSREWRGALKLLLQSAQILYYMLFAGLVKILGGLSGLKRIRCLAELLGSVRCRVGYIGNSRAVYLREIENCFPAAEPSWNQKLLRKSWNEHQQRFLELFIISQLSEQNLHKLIIFKNLEELDRLFSQRRGVILPVPHFGNVRLHHVALALAGYPISVVSGSYHMEPKYVRRMKLESEARIHRIGFISQGINWMIEVLRKGELLQIASTAEASLQGVWVTLLGRSLYFPTGWIRLAKLAAAPVLPTINYRLPDGRYCIEILPELSLCWSGDRRQNIRDNVQRLMDVFNPFYRSKPEMVDWMYWLVRCQEAETKVQILQQK